MPVPPELSLGHAIVLGAVQGAAERLPVSSSSHVRLLPWLMRWPEAGLSRGRRKQIELALHAGSTLAGVGSLRGHRLLVLALGGGPAGATGLLLRGAITRRLASPLVAVAGQAGGALVLALAHRRDGSRHGSDARAGDALAIGLAQVAALVPGVSRSGATLAAARARGFALEDARALSETAGLPVLLGASLLGAADAVRAADPAWRRSLAAGGATAALTSALTRRLARDRAGHAVAVYRAALVALALRRLRADGRRPLA